MENNDVLQNYENHIQDLDLIRYFLALKQTYQGQRQPWETLWDQSMNAYLVNEKIDKVYNGRANIRIPVLKWKVDGICSRIMKIIFNVEPFARIENPKQKSNQIDTPLLWNKYIFDHQLPEIGFKQAFKVFQRCKIIQGTAVAKVTQEYESKPFSLFDDVEAKEVAVKDNTYFRPMLLTEFYTDISKQNLQESAANIHSTTISMEQLRKNKKRTVKYQNQVVDQVTGQVLAIEEKEEEEGLYENLELLEPSGMGSEFTDEQKKYMALLGLNQEEQGSFQKELDEIRKNGFVKIDECYGLYDLDGDGVSEEIICVIANGRVVIRKEPTHFRHKKLVRPFISGVNQAIQNCFYGISNVITALSLYKELNASRSQNTDARTQSVFPMMYWDTSRQVVWDKIWRPNGIIKGNGPSGITPIINPNLGNVAINDSMLIQRDIDQTFSLSPIQEGTSDNRLIPKTLGGTQQVIAQNDMNLNDLIDSTVDNEIKPFLEMLYERNLRFKSPEDLLSVWTEEDLQKANLPIGQDGQPQFEMKDLHSDIAIKVLGTLELSNEVAHQQGWVSFGQMALQIPPIAGRVNWPIFAEKMLRSFGIKDDAENIFIDEETYQQSQEQMAKQQQQEIQNQLSLQQAAKGVEVQGNVAEHKAKTEIDTEADIIKMQNEAILEKSTGENIK